MTSTPNSNSVIDNYIKRVTELSQSGQRTPTAEELEKIAAELGVSNYEIQLAQKECQDHFVRGQSYFSLKHWDDAIEQFHEALVFNPTNLDVLYYLALGHLGRWRQKNNRTDEEQIRLRIKQCLQIQPDHAESLRLLGILNKEIRTRKSIKLGLGIGLVALMSSIGGFFLLNDHFYNLSAERQAKFEELEGRIAVQIDDLRQQQEELSDTVAKLENSDRNRILQKQIFDLRLQIARLEAKIRELENRQFSPFDLNS